MADEPVAPAAAAPTAPVAAPLVAPAASTSTPGIIDTAAAPVDPAAPVVDPAAPPAPAAPVVPETYEYKPPEGVTLDTAQLESFNARAKEMGLTQDQYKAAVDFVLERESQMASAPQKAFEAVQKQWVDTIHADTTISDGKALKPEAAAAIGQMMQRFGTPELREQLASTGLGNNPAFVKVFIEIGKAMQAAGPLDTGKPAPVGLRGNTIDAIAQRFYGQGA